MTPTPGSNWRAFYMWSTDIGAWHDEERTYQVDRVEDGIVHYHYTGETVLKLVEPPRYKIPVATWEVWVSAEGVQIDPSGERLRMVAE